MAVFTTIYVASCVGSMHYNVNCQLRVTQRVQFETVFLKRMKRFVYQDRCRKTVPGTWISNSKGPVAHLSFSVAGTNTSTDWDDCSLCCLRDNVVRSGSDIYPAIWNSLLTRVRHSHANLHSSFWRETHVNHDSSIQEHVTKRQRWRERDKEVIMLLATYLFSTLSFPCRSGGR